MFTVNKPDSDFQVGVNTSKLLREMKTAVASCIGIAQNPGSVDLIFEHEPTEEEMISVSAVVAAHTVEETYVYLTAMDMSDLRSRRQGVMDTLKIGIVYWLVMTGEATGVDDAKEIAKVFLREMLLKTIGYIEGDEDPLIDAITAATEDWLDNEVAQAGNKTIRTLILDRLA
jgi:hypothetical protein